MFPEHIRLYTWVDVEEVFLNKREQGAWPDSVLWARIYHDGVYLGIKPGLAEAARDWLRETFESRFDCDGDQWFILMEGMDGGDRILSVFPEEETEEQAYPPPVLPTLSRPVTIRPWNTGIDDEYPPPLKADTNLPPVAVFHSFKGGVGRTIHAIACANALAARSTDRNVLLIDADLEAPGISWLLEKRVPISPISFADFLALVHGDPDSEAQRSIDLVSDRMQNAEIENRLYVMSAYRSLEHFSSLEITPEHVVKSSDDPFRLSDMLSRLGGALKAGIVLVDLRAGLSEMSAGLVLDPRVVRILVTTLGGQSLRGTHRLLDLMRVHMPSSSSLRKAHPPPAVIISQIPPNLSDSDYLAGEESQFNDCLQEFIGAEESDDDWRIPDLIVRTPFFPDLLSAPSDWDEMVHLLHRGGIIESVAPLIDWLPRASSSAKDRPSIPDVQGKRKRLRDLAARTEYAERSDLSAFFASSALRHLASDNRNRVPIAVAVGAKGSGKTYTFLQLVQCADWQKFSRLAGKESLVRGAVYPLLAPYELEESANDRVRSAVRKIADEFGSVEPMEMDGVRERIRNWLKEKRHENEWMNLWLDLIASSVGFGRRDRGQGHEFLKYLSENGEKILVVIDGLEQLFTGFATKESEQICLRALLQDLPERLTQEPGRPLGLLVFIRRDIVLSAIPQNVGQFLNRYRPYALRWSREEALRLVAWVAARAEACPEIQDDKLHSMAELELANHLVPLWGKKLGGEISREARSTQWIMDALSDLNGQIQARDLVRFLRAAAQISVDEQAWVDRILIPRAVRAAVPVCSEEKIKELKDENPALKKTFEILEALDQTLKTIPFTKDEANLTADELEILHLNGVIVREGTECYMPEIFRHGLGFSLQKRGRPRVLALARRKAR